MALGGADKEEKNIRYYGTCTATCSICGFSWRHQLNMWLGLIWPLTNCAHWGFEIWWVCLLWAGPRKSKHYCKILLYVKTSKDHQFVVGPTPIDLCCKTINNKTDVTFNILIFFMPQFVRCLLTLHQHKNPQKSPKYSQNIHQAAEF